MRKFSESTWGPRTPASRWSTSCLASRMCCPTRRAISPRHPSSTSKTRRPGSSARKPRTSRPRARQRCRYGQAQHGLAGMALALRRPELLARGNLVLHPAQSGRRCGDESRRTAEGCRDHCPAYFGIPQREATAAAGRIAGLNVLEIINEPTAAAISYGLQDDEDQVVLVYDLGGGTFDVSIIEIKDGSVSVVATGGDHELGGRDWDEEVVKYLSQRWAAIAGSGRGPVGVSRDPAGPVAARRGSQAVTDLAHGNQVQVSHGGQRVAVTLTREKFDELTAHLLENTISLDQGHDRDRAGARYTRTSTSSCSLAARRAMPQVAERLQQEFGSEPQMHDPDQSVAKGAADLRPEAGHRAAHRH